MQGSQTRSEKSTASVTCLTGFGVDALRSMDAIPRLQGPIEEPSHGAGSREAIVIEPEKAPDRSQVEMLHPEANCAGPPKAPVAREHDDRAEQFANGCMRSVG